MANDSRLLSIKALALSPTNPVALQTSSARGGEVGTNATIGASTPATLSSASSRSVLPFTAMRATPMATRPPTKIEWVGV